MTSNHSNVEGGTFKKVPLETMAQKYNILELCKKKMNIGIDEVITFTLAFGFLIQFINYFSRVYAKTTIFAI